MEKVTKLVETLKARLTRTPFKDAVASRPMSVGNQHLLVLSELSFGFGAGGGQGEGHGEEHGKGAGLGAGGGAKASPVAVVVAQGDEVRLEQVNG